jgi:putative intracellular protease/amidase
LTQPVQRHVVFLLLPRVHLLDLAGPAQVFHAATDYGARYELRFCASSTDTSSAQGLRFKTETELPEVRRDDLIIIPGQWSKYMKNGPLLTARVKAWLRDAYKSQAHLASVCSGAFALGEAGFLNGRRLCGCAPFSAAVEINFSCATIEVARGRAQHATKAWQGETVSKTVSLGEGLCGQWLTRLTSLSLGGVFRPSFNEPDWLIQAAASIFMNSFVPFLPVRRSQSGPPSRSNRKLMSNPRPGVAIAERAAPTLTVIEAAFSQRFFMCSPGSNKFLLDRA